jgi:trafficking protein particle complex subunit 9
MSDGEHHYSLLSYLYCVSIIRHASALSAVWTARGWGQLALAVMINSHHIPPIPHASTPAALTQREKLTSLSGIARSQIADVLASAHGPWLLHLGHRERIEILEKLAYIYALIGYQRKEVYILREVIGCIMDLIVCGRTEGGSSSIIGLGIVDSPDGPLSRPPDPQEIAVRESDRADGNQSILSLVRYICGLHGIDLDTVKLVESSNTSEIISERADAQNELADDSGWPELRIGIAREALAIAEALPGTAH